MKRKLLYILLASIACLCLSVSCGKDEAEVIPRGKLAKIYAEMLVTDQWIITTSGVRMIADTSLVYEPILERYGYTTEDYMKSVDEYMKDPERFSRILRTTGEILDDRLVELRKAESELERKARLPKIESDFKAEEFFPYLFDEPYVHYYDSVAFEPDSALWIYRLVSIERKDTIYDRLRMVVLDSLSVADSVAVCDSLSVADSTDVVDSTLMEKLSVSKKSLKDFADVRRVKKVTTL